MRRFTPVIDDQYRISGGVRGKFLAAERSWLRRNAPLAYLYCFRAGQGISGERVKAHVLRFGPFLLRARNARKRIGLFGGKL